MAAKIFRINYKSDFILTMNSDAGWAIPFCIKFWTSVPSRAYFVGFDGTTYTHCAYDPSEPTKLVVQFDDHHLPIGDLNYQIAYHFTVADFPNDTEDEVINPAAITTEIDGETYHVMLDFTGETAPEIEFSLPAYANEAERIQNELQRQQNEADRIAAELQREQATAAAVQGAENVNAQLNGTTLTVTNRMGVSTSVNTKGEQGEQGPVGPEGPQGETGISIVSFTPKSETSTTLIYTITYSNGYTQDVAIPKGPKGDTGATGLTGPQGPQGDTGVSITGFVETGETETATLYNITFSNGTTQQVAIPKGEKGDTGEQGPVGPQGPQGPMGDVAVITPEQQAAFTMYSETGQNTNGPMTQKAVTDALGYIVASGVSYDNSQSGLAAENVQEALDKIHGETVLANNTGFNPLNESQHNANLPNIRITVANGGFTAEVIKRKGTSTADYVAGITCTSLKAGKTYEIEFDYVSGWSGSFQIRDASFNTDGNIFGVHTAGSGHISIVKTLTSDSGSFTFLLPQNTAVGKTLVVSNLVITEVTSLKDKVNDIDAELNYNLKHQITPVASSYYKLDVEIGSVANTIVGDVQAWQYARIPVEEGDVVCITGGSGEIPRLWGYLGSNFKLLDVAEPSISGRNLVKTIPSGVSYIVINSTVSSNPKWLFAKAGSAGADELLAYRTQQKLDDITADAIEASGLECSVVKTSGSGTTITIENTSENNYLIHCITKVGYTYVLIKLPTDLVEGKQYKITYTYSSTSSSTANFVFANSSRSKTADFSSFLANTQNRKVSVVFTHQSDYVYLMTYNNDISTGADITINDLTITVTHSITEIEDRISALEPTVTPSAYYNGMHVELGNDYGYIFTTTSTSIRCNEGMAMYGDYLVCAMLAAGTTYLNIYKQTDNVYGLVASLTNLSLSHANAMQFAPTLESGQTFPLLYVAGCNDRKCYVVQISVTSETIDDVTTDTYSASIVQTISFPTTKPFATTEHINAQIGDDGYLYVYNLTHGCTRLRCPQVSEGETITITEEDVYDYYEFYYPYATYVWQGGIIHKGMLFMPVGNSNKTKCLFVFDIYNHSLKALINLDAFMSSGEEPEDAEVYNGELYIAMYAGASATSSKAMKKIKFL